MMEKLNSLTTKTRPLRCEFWLNWFEVCRKYYHSKWSDLSLNRFSLWVITVQQHYFWKIITDQKDHQTLQCKLLAKALQPKCCLKSLRNFTNTMLSSSRSRCWNTQLQDYYSPTLLSMFTELLTTKKDNCTKMKIRPSLPKF